MFAAHLQAALQPTSTQLLPLLLMPALLCDGVLLRRVVTVGGLYQNQWLRHTLGHNNRGGALINHCVIIVVVIWVKHPRFTATQTRYSAQTQTYTTADHKENITVHIDVNSTTVPSLMLSAPYVMCILLVL